MKFNMINKDYQGTLSISSATILLAHTDSCACNPGCTGNGTTCTGT